VVVTLLNRSTAARIRYFLIGVFSSCVSIESVRQ
jgi:hypothetical protein